MMLQVITPEKILFEGEAAYVQIPGAEGEFGVLAGHAPTVSMLQPGIVGVELENGEKHEFAISGGVAEVTPERCTLLVEASPA